MNLSAPQLITPLLDGFVMGDPISSHDGVRACPAMHLETDKKYIVKIISLPATQAKLAALLLAGAFSDRESALDYFKELADGVIEEAELLQKLSKNEGFVSFENWQTISMEDDETGFDIYLLSPYRPTLDNALRTNELTHLQAINLGLDLCAALSACRRSGYIYGNLRPSNVYICNDREFRIGDLGFLSLNSLEFASLPDKYRSDYTPPEISDAFSSLNNTMDTYALGLILYQVYNDGHLPPVGGAMDVPKYADPALAEIILKACSVNPEDRWQDPVQMGQALATYMQSNSVNDTPIVPVAAEEAEPEPIFPDEDPEPSTDDVLAEVDQALEAAPEIIPAAPKEEEAPEETVLEAESASEQEEPEDAVVMEAVEETEENAAEEVSVIEEVEPEEERAEEIIEEPIAEEAVEEPEEAVEEVVSEEPAPEEPIDETAQMLAQADDLIAHQLPDPPVAPDLIEVTLPVPEEEPEEVAEAEESPEEESQESEVTEEEQAEEEPTGDEPEEASEDIAQPKKNGRKLLVIAIVLAATLLLSVAALLFYQFFYIQTIDAMTLDGTENKLTVTLRTDVEDKKLTVWCTDTHGNTLTQEVKDGKAHFDALKSGTKYTVEVRIDGFHKLIGEVTTDYTTATQTNITGFYATTGLEDGSVILSFTPQGPTSEQWTVTYSAEGEDERTMTFNGHIVTIPGLTTGKEYTFTIEPVTALYVTGTTSIQYTATQIIYPENATVMGFADGKLSLSWNAPEGVTVSKWFVHCYNDAGFDQTLSTEETFIVFENLDTTADYSVEVTAEGMTLGEKLTVSSRSATVTNLKADASNPTELKVSWDYSGTKTQPGWTVTYSIAGSNERKNISCTAASCVITPLIPGAHYTITVTGAADEIVYSSALEFDAPAAKSFDKYNVKASNMEFSMCKTPSKKGWDKDDVSNDDYTTTFKVGASASFVMHLTKKTNQNNNNVVTLYVVRDAEGKLISVNTESRTWDDMWDNRYGELTLPKMPAAAGSYTVEIYFDGMSVTTQSFTVA